MNQKNFQDALEQRVLPGNCNIMADNEKELEDDEEFVTHLLYLITDCSASLTGKRDVVYKHLHQIFQGLIRADAASTDIRTRIKVALFNGTTKSFNKVHLSPEKLANTFSESDYRCTGTTNGGAMFEYIDKELSGSNPAVKSLKKNSPKITIIITTDAQLNDNSALRAAAKKLLDSNYYFQKYCRVLVVFLGDEKDKATAVAMAGGKEENVVAISDDLTELLAPVIIESTVTFPDGTHVGGDSERSMSQLTEDARSRTQDGQDSADALADDDLHRKLLELMGGDTGKKVS